MIFRIRYLIVALAVLAGSYLIRETPILKQLFSSSDLRIYDTILDFDNALSYDPTQGAYDDICIVDIDEKSIANLGQYSTWPNVVFADLIDILNADKPLAIAFDVFFTERDSLMPYPRSRLIDQFKGLNVNADDIINHLSTEKLLIQSIAKAGNVYLAMFNSKDTADDTPLPPNLHPWKLSPKSYLPLEYPHPPVPKFSQAARGVGFAQIEPDISLVIHDFPLFLGYRDSFYVNFSFQMCLDLLGIDSVVYQDRCKLYSQGRLVKDIPLSPDGLFFMKFYGPQGAFRHIPLSDVLQHRIAPTYFADRIILVGSSASGLRDIQPVPLDPGYPGIEMHATFIRNLLESDFVQWLNKWLILAINIVLLALLIVIIRYTKPLLSILLFLFSSALMMLGLFVLYHAKSITFPYSAVILPWFGGFIALMITESQEHLKEKKKVHNAFEHYVSKEVISEIMKGSQALKTGGEKKTISILFADVRNFTSLCEKMAPSEITAFMNDYFDQCTELITAHHGMLDKYIGDAVLALFGAPLSTPDFEGDAVKTALAIRDFSFELQAGNADHPYLKDFRIGIGIATGELIVGNIGSTSIFNYTGLGDKMNTCSRLENLNKYYHTSIIADEATIRKVKGRVLYRKLDTVSVKGKEQQADIFEVLGEINSSSISEAIRESYSLYESALKQIIDKQPDEARKLLEKAQALNPDDYPTQLMLERLQIINWENWNGVWAHDRK